MTPNEVRGQSSHRAEIIRLMIRITVQIPMAPSKNRRRAGQILRNDLSQGARVALLRRGVACALFSIVSPLIIAYI